MSIVLALPPLMAVLCALGGFARDWAWLWLLRFNSKPNAYRVLVPHICTPNDETPDLTGVLHVLTDTGNDVQIPDLHDANGRC